MAEEAVKDVEMSENRAEFDSVEDESSGSSSSDSEPDEETEKLQITSLEKTLQESPSNYEVHVQVCLRLSWLLLRSEIELMQKFVVRLF